jgi:hypothetical protein
MADKDKRRATVRSAIQFRKPAMHAESGCPWKGLDDLEIAATRWVALFDDGSTPGSGTGRRPRSKPSTTLANLSPMRHETPSHQSLHGTWTGSS